MIRDKADSHYYFLAGGQWLTAATLAGPWSVATKHLTAGRWFSSNTLEGPWTFATPNLPEDFARIPQSSPAAQVLASVPGTDEAKDSVLMAQIPTTAIVDPKAAAETAKVAYDGDPKFEPIQGTSMQYATNTSQKVIKQGDVYYLCLQGVWFLATTPQGPWQTAPSVPPEIYTIPPSSPVYNVTYVTQVTTSSGAVEASYTAYGPYGSATRSASDNPYTGTAARSASVSTPYGKASVGQAYNPYTGAYGATKQGSQAIGVAISMRRNLHGSHPTNSYEEM